MSLPLSRCQRLPPRHREIEMNERTRIATKPQSYRKAVNELPRMKSKDKTVHRMVRPAASPPKRG